LKEVCLLNQEDVTGEDKKTVRETLKAVDAELKVLSFKRVNLNVD
jgi:translation elongation factor EF-Ts